MSWSKWLSWGQRVYMYARRKHPILVTCTSCHETYRTDPADLTHDEREDGTTCGGRARPLQRWERR